MPLPKTLYAQLEQAGGEHDYWPNMPCLRFIGIDEPSFRSNAFNSEDGCATYLLDIDWRDINEVPIKVGAAELPSGWKLPPFEPLLALDEWPSSLWARIELSQSYPDKETRSYGYQLFADAEPSYVRPLSMMVQNGPAVIPPQAGGRIQNVPAKQRFKLYAYHVGQGMCALLKGQTEGFIFDLGAGAPVTRAEFRKRIHGDGRPFQNDLRAATQHLNLQALISHPDSDHWRLLDWDAGLRTSVSDIFVPQGTPMLALKAKQVIQKVHALNNLAVTDAGGASLFSVHRSQPSASDRNGECLLIETQCVGRCFFPGDYVYSRWASDGNSAIRALCNASCDAVMVPHHGDAASANLCVTPARWQRTPAFFSAGTHKAYKHPTPVSLIAHAKQGFDVINKNACDDIVELLIS